MFHVINFVCLAAVVCRPVVLVRLLRFRFVDRFAGSVFGLSPLLRSPANLALFFCLRLALGVGFPRFFGGCVSSGTAVSRVPIRRRLWYCFLLHMSCCLLALLFFFGARCFCSADTAYLCLVRSMSRSLAPCWVRICWRIPR